MNLRRVLAALGAGLALVALIPAGAAQDNNTTTTPPPTGGDLNGMDTEFGSIRMPVQREFAGDPVSVEARINLKSYYGHKDAKFFLFGFNTQSSSVTVKFDSITLSDGTPLNVFKDERTGSQPQVFVDLRDLPPVGSEIVLQATVSSSANGQFQVGALVIAFDYHWNKVRMDNGLEAQLYGYTTVSASGGFGGGLFKGKGNVPGFELTLALAALGAVALVAGARRRGRGGA